MGGNDQPRIVVPVQKGPGSVMHGLKMVQGKMESGQIFICHDAREEGVCPISKKEHLRTSTEQEIPSYVWYQQKEDTKTRDAPDPRCDDHGCDAMRYACVWMWGRDLTDEEDTRVKPGTFADIVGHQEFLDEQEDYEDDDDFYPDWN